MRVALFCHSIASDWNHGNAHFLRGIASELLALGHDVAVYEPADAWSVANLVAEHGEAALDAWLGSYPHLGAARRVYTLETLDLDRALDGVDLVLVHEWNEPELVRRIGAHRAAGGRHRLLFHDTHHRSVTDPAAMATYDLRHYDGVLAFGAAVREEYLRRGWAQRVWTWHEAADTRVFAPRADVGHDGDLVWIGNWGDDERADELGEFLLEPVRALQLRARVHGVRYPAHAREALDAAGIEYAGWLPNHQAPCVFARHRATVHVPRRPYVRALPGVPTIRVFEALACGIPLVTAPWDDVEGLFTPGADFLVATSGVQMQRQLRTLYHEPAAAHEIAARGRATILARHTCRHRVQELLAIATELGMEAPA